MKSYQINLTKENFEFFKTIVDNYKYKSDFLIYVVANTIFSIGINNYVNNLKDKNRSFEFN